MTRNIIKPAGDNRSNTYAWFSDPEEAKKLKNRLQRLTRQKWIIVKLEEIYDNTV